MTSKPLFIVVHPDLGRQPWIEELRAKGHTVAFLALEHAGADMILGPNCMRLVPGMERFLEAFIKGARMVRYPGSKKESA